MTPKCENKEMPEKGGKNALSILYFIFDNIEV
jgi:hypothetical protein